MSKRNRERRKRRPSSQRPERQPDPPALDVEALARIANYRGDSIFGGGGPIAALDGYPGDHRLPVVEPLEPIADQMDFDRRICGAGLKAFVRPRTAEDWPESLPDAPGPRYAHVVVRELSPGIRVKSPVAFQPFHELN